MVIFYKTSGSYDFAHPSEKQWAVFFQDGDVRLSERWPIDEEPDIDGCLPSDVLDLIEARVKSYWINTRRDEDLLKIAKLRERKLQMDIEFLSERISKKEASLAQLRKQRQYLLDEQAETECAADSAGVAQDK